MKKVNEIKIDLDFRLKVEKELKKCNYNDNYVAFWCGVFSNFYPAYFYLDGKEWSSSEKYFMYMKAITFNDNEIAEKIYQSDNPKEIKKLGRLVKNFNNETWDKVKEGIMYRAVYAKFIQDGLCNRCIKEFQKQIFVEGSPYDKIWGVGIKFDDDKIFDKKNWHGENLLGKILTRVRDEIFEDAYNAMIE